VFASQIYARPSRVDDPELDGYSRRGVVVSRCAAHELLAALRRDTYELRSRGGDANCEAAEMQDALAKALLEALR
jgi:hypothetical protein